MADTKQAMQEQWALCAYGCGTYVHLNPSNPTARLAVWNHFCLNKLAILRQLNG